MLCISTSERVLHTPFAGQNHFFNAKTTFCLIFLFFCIKEQHLNAISPLYYCIFCMILSGFLYFVPLATEKVVIAAKSLFRPAKGVRSTRLLVEIHNRLISKARQQNVKSFGNKVHYMS